MKTIAVWLIVLSLSTIPLAAAFHGDNDGNGEDDPHVITTYSQVYQVSGPGAITVVCPDTETSPITWTDCVPHMESPGVPPEKQMWIGGVGIDVPIVSRPLSVAIDDASGLPSPGAVCVDHDMDNFCGPSDPDGFGMGPEPVIFFCGAAEIPQDFSTEPMPGMTTRHIDVWVRGVGNLQHFLGQPQAPFCSGLTGDGPLGVGTRGTVSITVEEPAP